MIPSDGGGGANAKLESGECAQHRNGVSTLNADGGDSPHEVRLFRNAFRADGKGVEDTE